MPGILHVYRNLNILMLSIKTSGDFYLFYDFFIRSNFDIVHAVHGYFRYC